jgi:hypothetical protein
MDLSRSISVFSLLDKIPLPADLADTAVHNVPPNQGGVT